MIFRSWLQQRLNSSSTPYTLDQIYDILATRLEYCRPYNEKFKCFSPRDQFACGDVDINGHKYSGVDVPMIDWRTAQPPILGIMDVRDAISADPILMEITKKSVPNSCLVNYYRDGNDGVGYHRDKELKDSSQTVYTITLGCARKFVLKHDRTKKRIETLPLPGDLVVMTGTTQKLWKLGQSPNLYTWRRRLHAQSMKFLK